MYVYIQGSSSDLFAATPAKLTNIFLDDDQDEIEVTGIKEEVDVNDIANVNTQVHSTVDIRLSVCVLRLSQWRS